MTMRWKSILLATLIAVALVSQSPQVVAQAVEGDAQAEKIDSSKFWDYGLCGVSIVVAAGTGGWLLAFFVCGKVASEHWIK
jgi:hypothetical protein